MYEYWNYYDVTPRMVPADRESTVTIRPRFTHVKFPPADRIKVRVIPLDDGVREGGPEPLRGWELDADGALRIRANFTGEQEYNLTLELTEPGNREADEWALRGRETLRFNVYSLRADFYERRPFKGDFHMHSWCSDGREAPEYVAARNREEGFDFIAVTDHHRYAPSQQAIRVWSELPTDLKLFPGEEVHSPDNPVHIINFGGSFSVNELARSGEERYRREVAAIAETLGPEVRDRFAVAASEWVFERIREGGGLAVFCHPYWQTEAYVINEGITTAILNRRKFDALELIGGFYKHQWRSNNFQIARYDEERAGGNAFPVVGLSDSHGTDTGALFGWYYTVVLAKSDRLEDLVEAVRSGFCCAVEHVEGGIPRVFGEFRMVKYISFLLESYFPRHKALCRTEGALMSEALAGSNRAVEALKMLAGSVAAYRESCFR